MFEESDYKTVGMHKAIFCASIGLLTALVINLLLGTIVLAFNFPVPVIAGVIGLYACAYFYGKIAGQIVHRIGAGNFNVWLIGIILAWSCVITMGLVGSSIYFFKELNDSTLSETFFDYIFKPVFWVGFFGVIPALILGLVWAKQMKKEFKSRI